MADIFQLFDGTLGVGGSSAISKQNASSFSTVSTENDLIGTLASGTDSVSLLIDYSDFSNFVTFNSAESYVTITADEIINSYPIDGTADDVQRFYNGLDGFQRYFLDLWPSCSGHLRFNPAISPAYVRVDDFGVQDGVSKTSFLSPGTGSLSIQGWIDVPTMTGSNDVQVILQKQLVGSTDGYSVFLSASSIFMNVSSGSTTAMISANVTQMPTFFAAVLDTSAVTGTLSLYIGTTGSYPTLQSSVGVIIGPRYDLASGSFFIGSGSMVGAVVRPFTGSLDEISVWSIPRSLSDLSGSYNGKVYAQSGLIGLWHFNNATTASPTSLGSIVRDASGHRLDGRIQSFNPNILGSGSLIPEVPDPIMSLDDPNVVAYVVNAQVTGSLYDRNNTSLIFNMFPDAFSQGDATSIAVFQNFVLILARHFDRIKTYINQLVNLRRVNHGDFDQAPDELLYEVGRYFGWELQGNFATTDALRYFIGQGVKPGPGGNIGLNTRLADIKSAFWRRILLNLMYLYKTKGTRESVESLLRIYGVDNGFVRLKEYARRTESRLPVNRVVAEKSVYALQFMSGATVSFTGR